METAIHSTLTKSERKVDDLIAKLSENLPEGTWEFVTHPGYNDAELNNVNTRLRHSRENELSIFTSSEVKELLRGEQIELISYREFLTTRQVSPEVLSPSAGAK